MDTASPPKPPRRMGGWRITALLEIAVFLAGALLLDRYVFASDRFASVQPHPFWIIILLMAAQYGTGEALLAAVASTAALLIGNIPDQPIDQDIYAYILELARNPILWLLTVVFIGEIGRRHRNRIAELSGRLVETEQHIGTLDDAYRKLAAAKTRLEVRVAGQMKTVVSLYQAARAIDRLAPEEVLTGVDQIIRTILDPQQYSVFLLEDGRLQPLITEGWATPEQYGRRFDSNSALFRAVIGQQRMLNASQPEDLDILADEGLMAGPLLSADTGEVFGMVKVEQIGFLDFNLSTVENFRVTCDWIATAYAHALRFRKAEAGSAYDSSRSLFAAGFRERQTRIVLDLARRIGFPVSALRLSVQGAEQLPASRRPEISAAVGQAVHAALRDTDLAFETRASGWDYDVVLPATPHRHATIAGDKLKTELTALLAREHPGLRISIAVHRLYDPPADDRPGAP
ncbi:GAF domain-containing protein [Ferrovibrio xuzhouensis]|uniref:GAF domain-containing protein n=1 Tax=Ferrovibrio xuzhouensis TaxID=1576914 RepID=A0ABV7VF81_9PROT